MHSISYIIPHISFRYANALELTYLCLILPLVCECCITAIFYFHKITFDWIWLGCLRLSRVGEHRAVVTLNSIVRQAFIELGRKSGSSTIRHLKKKNAASNARNGNRCRHVNFATLLLLYNVVQFNSSTTIHTHTEHVTAHLSSQNSYSNSTSNQQHPHEYS